jgi:hypothetical protein
MLQMWEWAIGRISYEKKKYLRFHAPSLFWVVVKFRGGSTMPLAQEVVSHTYTTMCGSFNF